MTGKTKQVKCRIISINDKKPIRNHEWPRIEPKLQTCLSACLSNLTRTGNLKIRGKKYRFVDVLLCPEPLSIIRYISTMLNHSSILLVDRFKRLPYPKSIVTNHFHLNFMKSRCILFGPKSRVLESNSPQEPCYVLFNINPKKLSKVQHPFLETAMAPPKGGKAGEELVKTLVHPTFHSKHCELWSCEMTRSTDPVTSPTERWHCVPWKSLKLWRIKW